MTVNGPSGAAIDAGDARRRLLAAAQRSAELIGSLDIDRHVEKSAWTVGDTAAHLIVILRLFTDSLTGGHHEWRRWHTKIRETRTPERIAALNRLSIAAEPRRSPTAAAQAITEAAQAFLAATDTMSPGLGVPTPWYGPSDTLTVAEATCLLLGEQVIHGYDIAKAVGQKWPITTEDALHVFQAARRMLPKLADSNTLGNVTATYEIHLGRSTRFVLRSAAGTAIVEPATGQRIDCHILGEPVTMLLFGYGRVSQWRAIGGAKMVAWGPKPWLALRFKTYFSNP